MPLDTKSDFYRLFRQGRFGNKTQVYDSAQQALDQGPDQGLYALRSRRQSAFKTRYGLLKPALKWMTLEHPVLPAEEQNVSLMAPDDQLLWQGEFVRDHQGLRAHVSFLPTAMKLGLRQDGSYWTGLRVRHLLEQTLWPASLEDLREIEQDFPHHAIELSVYRVAVGDCPHRNTIIWEVRNY